MKAMVVSLVGMLVVGLNGFCFAENSPYKSDSHPNEKGVVIHTYNGDSLKYIALYKKKVKGGVKLMIKSLDKDSSVLYVLSIYDCKGNSMELGEGDTKEEAERPLKNPNRMFRIDNNKYNMDVQFSKYACN